MEIEEKKNQLNPVGGDVCVFWMSLFVCVRAKWGEGGVIAQCSVVTQHFCDVLVSKVPKCSTSESDKQIKRFQTKKKASNKVRLSEMLDELFCAL